MMCSAFMTMMMDFSANVLEFIADLLLSMTIIIVITIIPITTTITLKIKLSTSCQIRLAYIQGSQFNIVQSFGNLNTQCCLVSNQNLCN